MFSFSTFRGAENSGSKSDKDNGNTDVHDHPDNGENGDSDDDSRLGFDDVDVDDLEEEVAESEEELMTFKVAQLKIKLAERGLIQTGGKPELISRLLNPQPSDFKNKPKIEPWKTSKAKHFSSGSSGIKILPFTF